MSGPTEETEREKAWIEPYGGVANRARLVLFGRVRRGRPHRGKRGGPRWWRNLRAIVRRMRAEGVPGARVAVDSPAPAETRADKDGYFALEVRAPLPADADGDGAFSTDLRVRDERLAPPGPARTEVTHPDPATRFLVISDVDDTILPMAAFGWLRTAVTVLFGDARSRTAFPGVGPFTRGLRDGTGGTERNLLYYVSSSPWNVHGILMEFFALNRIPVDALLLRSWADGLFPKQHRDHKELHIDRILELHPELPALLVGDSSAEDPEIYLDVVERHPDRVLAIYIRDVGIVRRGAEVEALAEECRAHGVDLLLAGSTEEMAAHAAERGWITGEALEEVRRENR